MLCHCISVLSFLAAVPLYSLAETLSPRWEDMRTKHSWNAVPKNWESLGSPPNDTMIDLYIVLKPRRENSLIDALYEVSSPGHPRYGAHLSKEQVAILVAPHPETLELVNSWLEHYDIPTSSVSMTHGGNTLMLEEVSVTQADTLLGTSYQVYRHVESSETIVRTVGYALPAVLHEHVLTVAPTTSFVSPRPRWQTPRNQSGGVAGGVAKSTSRGPATNLSSRDNVNSLTPSFLRSLYDTETYKPAAKDRNVLGIAGYLDDYPSPTDLEAFLYKYRSDAADATLSVVQVNGGGYDPSQPNAEANLDTQYAEAMAYPTPVIFYSTGRGPRGTQDWYISWFRYILSQPSIPQTISTSYSTDESLCSKEYAMYVCRLFAQLGARGVSVLFPSGDNGVGKDCVRDGSVRFNPEFPSTCPWVTVVGGTTGYEPEVAASFSGGGFSKYFARPKYQQQAVSFFLADLGDRHQGLFNESGRGIPDIAAQANGFPIFFKGIEDVVGGTSSSTPVVAGIISLLNDYLISKGRAPLGFLNPWLYGKGLETLTDITDGSNPGCGTVGFNATIGWDPVTGLGTLDLRSMLQTFGGLGDRAYISQLETNYSATHIP